MTTGNRCEQPWCRQHDSYSSLRCTVTGHMGSSSLSPAHHSKPSGQCASGPQNPRILNTSKGFTLFHLVTGFLVIHLNGAFGISGCPRVFGEASSSTWSSNNSKAAIAWLHSSALLLRSYVEISMWKKSHRTVHIWGSLNSSFVIIDGCKMIVQQT